jgi:hypothetical protein
MPAEDNDIRGGLDAWATFMRDRDAEPLLMIGMTDDDTMVITARKGVTTELVRHLLLQALRNFEQGNVELVQ